MTRLLACAALAAVALAVTGQAQAQPPGAVYREDQPATLAPPRPVDPDAASNAALESFAVWNRANNPSFLIYWNRELTDDAATRYTDRTVKTDDGRSSRAQTNENTNTDFGTASKSNDDSIDHRVTTTDRSQVVTNPSGQHSAMDPAASKRMETAYVNVFMGVGAKLVDRTSVLRSLSAGPLAKDRSDARFLESTALQQGIDYLIEILPDAAPQAATQVMFTVKITHLPTNRLVAQFVSSATPPSIPGRIAATPNGFARQAPQARNSPEMIAGQLAVLTMSSLMQR